MDDFMNEKRLAIFTPDKLAQMRKALHTAVEGRELKLWNVIYAQELDEKLKPWLDEIDVVTAWAWYAEDLMNLEKNYAGLKRIMGEDKPLLAGCYMYDYGNCKEMPSGLIRAGIS